MHRDLSHLALILIAMLLSSLSGCADNAKPAPARNVIMISIDTLRADRLGTYGNSAPTSPSLDAAAAQGVVFDKAITAAPWTLPSHASMVTGRYPSGHGLRTLELRMNQGIPTLGTVLRDRGFDTGAFVNVLFLGGGSGFPRGFDDFLITPSKPSRAGAAKEVVSHIKTWLSEPREKPVFLFAHFFDPHSGYQSLPQYEAMFVGDEPNRFDGSTRQIIHASTGKIPPVEAHEADHLRLLYDAGIRQLDDELGIFFAWLQNGGWLKDTLVVVTSDHGEEFLDHARLLHGETHYDEVMQVPLIMFGAGVPRGVRIATPVSIVDIVPTVLGVLNEEPIEGIDGHDLRALWDAPQSEQARFFEQRAILSETGPEMEDNLRSVRKGRHKLIVNVASDEQELFDLIDDPGETRNIAPDHPELVAVLVKELESLTGRGLGTERAPPMSQELRDRLQALGYAVPDEG